MSRGTTTLSVDASAFVVQCASASPVLNRAIARYRDTLFFPFETKDAKTPGASVTTLTIYVLADDGKERPTLTTDESYQLSVNAPSSTITANSIFGAMRGLETFSQLIDYDWKLSTYSIPSTPVTISDTPRFPWRGLLIDSSRHYLDIATIKRIIDALSYNKMNVLHWHLVDAQSFPVSSQAYPLLSNGAYHPLLVYDHAAISSVVQYATDRGVRVLPEFDMPGHAASWGVGYPNVTVYCPSYEHNINNIPLDPTIDFTYTLIQGLFLEMSTIFPEEYIHTGGDEVVYGCWSENPNVNKFMQDRGWTTIQLEQYFCDKVEATVASLKRKLAVWEDEMDNGITMDAGTLVQVWKSSTSMRTAVTKNLNAILSQGWYLAKQQPVSGTSIHSLWLDTWMDMYGVDPMTGLTDLPPAQQALVLGGEACMWGEQADPTNIDGMIWPRASAGERLWSPSTYKNTTEAKLRLIEFRCRSAQRGVSGGPLTPDFCFTVPPSP
eukprot:TRINITY_DN1143_c0_g1_i5.p1 TRINITY_DN1143_c0_g1~~TRINITY_DN1143_c0_g1_i5.p1  ORF type:complete len:516 (+),score=96.17 TRINITY_DN1143_c0_g1_i5:68-1549(+)